MRSGLSSALGKARPLRVLGVVSQAAASTKLERSRDDKVHRAIVIPNMPVGQTLPDLVTRALRSPFAIGGELRVNQRNNSVDHWVA